MNVSEKTHKLKFLDNLGWIALRGALLGFSHLTIYNLVMGFLEQESDPFGTSNVNLDA